MWIFKFLCFYIMTELASCRPLQQLGFIQDYAIHEAAATTRAENHLSRNQNPYETHNMATKDSDTPDTATKYTETPYAAPKNNAFNKDVTTSDEAFKSKTDSSENTKPNQHGDELTNEATDFTPNSKTNKEVASVLKSITTNSHDGPETFNTAQIEDLLNMIKKKAIDKRNNRALITSDEETMHYINQRSSDENKPSLANNIKNMYKKVFKKVTNDFKNELDYTVASFKEITGFYDTTTSKGAPNAIVEKTSTEDQRKQKTSATPTTSNAEASDMDNENTDGQEKNDSTESFTSTTSESTTSPSGKETGSEVSESSEEPRDTEVTTTTLKTKVTHGKNTQKSSKKGATRTRKQTVVNNKLNLDNLTNSMLNNASDNFNMLYLYENMMSTTKNDKELSAHLTKRKRDTETLSDFELDEEVFTSREYTPETPYNVFENTHEPTSENFDFNLDNVQEPENAEKLSLSPLETKRSYNDYINGYKYYLNYQRDLGKDHFSDLVKYQAHKHHKVDDIGKFILEKLPTVPVLNRVKRNEFSLDDEDTFTKNDDSWFKKHFYLFIDSGSPKKFHSSQTVPMKTLEAKTDNNADDSKKPAAKDSRLMENSAQNYRSAYASPLFGSELGMKARDTELPVEKSTTPRSSFITDLLHKIIDIKEVMTTTSLSLLYSEPRTDSFVNMKFKRETQKNYVKSESTSPTRRACKQNDFSAVSLVPKKAVNHAKKVKRKPLFSRFNFRQKLRKERLSKHKRQVTQRNTRFLFKKWKNLLKEQVLNSPTVTGYPKATEVGILQSDNISQMEMKFMTAKQEPYKVPSMESPGVEMPNYTFENPYSLPQSDKTYQGSSTYASQNILSSTEPMRTESIEILSKEPNPYMQDYSPKTKESDTIKLPDALKTSPYKMPSSYKSPELDGTQKLNETMNENPLENASETYGAKSVNPINAPVDASKASATTTEPWSTKAVDTYKVASKDQVPVRLDFEWLKKSTMKDDAEPWSLTRFNVLTSNTPATAYMNLLAEGGSTNRMIGAKNYPVYDSKAPSYEDLEVITDAEEVLPHPDITWDSTRYLMPQQEHHKAKQFFTTPIPMKINEFDKYKVNEIDSDKIMDKLAVTAVSKIDNYQRLLANPTKIIKMDKMRTPTSNLQYRANTFDEDEVTEVSVSLNTFDDNDLLKELGDKDLFDILKYKNAHNDATLNENKVTQRTEMFPTRQDIDPSDRFDVLDFEDSLTDETTSETCQTKHSSTINWTSLSPDANTTKRISETLRDMYKIIGKMEKTHMFKAHPDLQTIEEYEKKKTYRFEDKPTTTERFYESEKYPEKSNKNKNVGVNLPALEQNPPPPAPAPAPAAAPAAAPTPAPAAAPAPAPAAAPAPAPAAAPAAAPAPAPAPAPAVAPSTTKPQKVQISNHVYKFDIVYSNAQAEESVEADPKAAKQEKPKSFDEGPSYNIEKNESSTVATIVYTPVYIDLPTYYEPNSHLPEVEIVVTRKELWHDHIMRCLSGLALVELLRKYGFNKTIDGDSTTDSININSNKVYRDRVMKRNAELAEPEQMRDRRFDGDTLKFWKKKQTTKAKLSTVENTLSTSKTINTMIKSDKRPSEINGAINNQPTEYQNNRCNAGDHADNKHRRSFSCTTRSFKDLFPFMRSKTTTTAQHTTTTDCTMVGKMLKEMEDKARTTENVDSIENKWKSCRNFCSPLSLLKPIRKDPFSTMRLPFTKLRNADNDKAKKNIKRYASVTQFTVKDVSQLDIVMDMEKKIEEISDSKDKREIQLVINSVSGTNRNPKQANNVTTITTKMNTDPTLDTPILPKRIDSKAFIVDKLSPDNVLYQRGSLATKTNLYGHIEDSELNAAGQTEFSNGLYFIEQKGDKIVLNPLQHKMTLTSPTLFINITKDTDVVLSQNFISSMQAKLNKIYNVLINDGASLQFLNENSRKKRNYNNNTQHSKNYNVDILGASVQKFTTPISKFTENYFDNTDLNDNFSMKSKTNNISTAGRHIINLALQKTVPTLYETHTEGNRDIASSVDDAIGTLKGITANILQNTLQISKSVIDLGQQFEDVNPTELIESVNSKPSTRLVYKSTHKSTTAPTLIIASDYDGDYFATQRLNKKPTASPTINSPINSKQMDIHPDFLQILEAASEKPNKTTKQSTIKTETTNFKVSKKITTVPSSWTNAKIQKQVVTKLKKEQPKKEAPKKEEPKKEKPKKEKSKKDGPKKESPKKSTTKAAITTNSIAKTSKVNAVKLKTSTTKKKIVEKVKKNRKRRFIVMKSPRSRKIN